ncbi:MAG: hypothetical protein V1835_03085 [Candidatus Micrarchaeota archaeon]
MAALKLVRWNKDEQIKWANRVYIDLKKGGGLKGNVNELTSSYARREMAKMLPPASVLNMKQRKQVLDLVVEKIRAVPLNVTDRKRLANNVFSYLEKKGGFKSGVRTLTSPYARKQIAKALPADVGIPKEHAAQVVDLVVDKIKDFKRTQRLRRKKAAVTPTEQVKYGRTARILTGKGGRIVVSAGPVRRIPRGQSESGPAYDPYELFKAMGQARAASKAGIGVTGTSRQQLIEEAAAGIRGGQKADATARKDGAREKGPGNALMVTPDTARKLNWEKTRNVSPRKGGVTGEKEGLPVDGRNMLTYNPAATAEWEKEQARINRLRTGVERGRPTDTVPQPPIGQISRKKAQQETVPAPVPGYAHEKIISSIMKRYDRGLSEYSWRTRYDQPTLEVLKEIAVSSFLHGANRGLEHENQRLNISRPTESIWFNERYDETPKALRDLIDTVHNTRELYNLNDRTLNREWVEKLAKRSWEIGQQRALGAKEMDNMDFRSDEMYMDRNPERKGQRRREERG